MTTTRQDIGTNPRDPLVEGDTRIIRITVDLGGGTPEFTAVRWQAFAWPGGRRHSTAPPAAEPTISKSLDDGITVPEPGIIEVRLAPADTQTRGGHYHHECEVVDVDGNVATVATGELVITDQRVV